MVEGNTQHRYKEAMALLEEASPGTKHQMYFGFLKKAAGRFAEPADEATLVRCTGCGAPTLDWGQDDPQCSFCKTKTLALKRKETGDLPRRTKKTKNDDGSSRRSAKNDDGSSRRSAKNE